MAIVLVLYPNFYGLSFSMGSDSRPCSSFRIIIIPLQFPLPISYVARISFLYQEPQRRNIIEQTAFKFRQKATKRRSVAGARSPHNARNLRSLP